MPTRYTANDWESYQPALRTFTGKTLEVARAVLVEGKAPAVVARELNTSRQLVHSAAKRVQARLDSHAARKLVPVTVWVPADQVEAVIALARAQGGIEDESTP